MIENLTYQVLGLGGQHYHSSLFDDGSPHELQRENNRIFCTLVSAGIIRTVLNHFMNKGICLCVELEVESWTQIWTRYSGLGRLIHGNNFSQTAGMQVFRRFSEVQGEHERESVCVCVREM